MLLKDLKPGDKGRIVSYSKDAVEYRRRLLMAPRPVPLLRLCVSPPWAIRLKFG